MKDHNSTPQNLTQKNSAWMAVCALAIAAFALLAGTAASDAANGPDYWSGASDNTFLTAGNWVGGSGTSVNTPPSSGDSLFFDVASGGGANTTLTANQAAGISYAGITFNADSSAYTISAGNSFALTGALVNNSTQPQNFTTPITEAATQTFTTTTGGGNISLNGIVSGAGGITTSGTGTLILGAANTFSGATTVGSGTTVQLNSNWALTNSTVNYTAGTLTFGNGITTPALGGLTGTASTQNLTLPSGLTLAVGNNSVADTYAGQISGAGSLIVSNNLSVGTANYTGNTTVYGNGILTINGGSFGSSSSTIGVANPAASPGSAVAATMNINNATATAGTVDVGNHSNETGTSLNLTGTTSASFGTTVVGATGDVSYFGINTSGTVFLGNGTFYKDLNAARDRS